MYLCMRLNLIGAYRLDIYSFHNGAAAAHQSSTLQVNEVGIELWISQVALRHSAAFGVLLTLLAVVLGLALSMLLRHDHGRRL